MVDCDLDFSHPAPGDHAFREVPGKWSAIQFRDRLDDLSGFQA